MADYKMQLISEVAQGLTTKIDPDDITIVSEEMAITLKDYDVTKRTTELVVYDGINEQIIKKYKACMIIAGRSPKTIYQYERCLMRLFQVVQRNYTDMTVSDLRYFLAYEKSRGISNRTLENVRVQVQSFFNWLVDEDMIIKNPCKTIAPIKYTSKVKEPFSSIEIDAMRSACKNTKERAIVEFLLATGVRVSELCSILLSDINFDTNAIIVREGKGQKQRTVYMNDLAKKHLLIYFESRNVNGTHLFYNKWKEPINEGGVRHILKSIEERAGLANVHPHRFRRTFATQLSNRGMPVQEIQHLLGHSDLNTTMEYVITSDDRVHVSYLKYSA